MRSCTQVVILCIYLLEKISSAIMYIRETHTLTMFQYCFSSGSGPPFNERHQSLELFFPQNVPSFLVRGSRIFPLQSLGKLFWISTKPKKQYWVTGCHRETAYDTAHIAKSSTPCPNTRMSALGELSL